MVITYSATEPTPREHNVDLRVGLTLRQVEAHRQKYGSNVADMPKPELWWKNQDDRGNLECAGRRLGYSSDEIEEVV